MNKILGKKSLQLFACLLTFLTVSNVNSACFLLFGQDEEPKTLNRFKRIK